MLPAGFPTVGPVHAYVTPGVDELPLTVAVGVTQLITANSQ